MVQLKVLSGKQAGAVTVARRFPFIVGRDASANLRLEEEGVWERHLERDLQMPEGFVLIVNPKARATVNDQPVQQALLRNGDLLGVFFLQAEDGIRDYKVTGVQTCALPI